MNVVNYVDTSKFEVKQKRERKKRKIFFYLPDREMGKSIFSFAYLEYF